MIFFLAFIILFLPISIIYPTKVICKKKLPKRGDGAYILSCNHYSNLDPVLLDIKLAKKINFLAKKELFKSKISRFFLKKLGAIKIDRQSQDISAFKNALTILKKGKPLGIFPEGTRNKSEDNFASMQQAKSGAIVLAGKANVPIIPVAFYRKPRPFARNKILIGDPYYIIAQNPKKLSKEEIEQNTNNLVEITNMMHNQLVNKYSKNAKKATK